MNTLKVFVCTFLLVGFLFPQAGNSFGCYSLTVVLGGIGSCNVEGNAYVSNCTLHGATRLGDGGYWYACAFTEWADNTSTLSWSCTTMFGTVIHQGQATIRFGEFIVNQHNFMQINGYNLSGGYNNCGCGYPGDSNRPCYN